MPGVSKRDLKPVGDVRNPVLSRHLQVVASPLDIVVWQEYRGEMEGPVSIQSDKGEKPVGNMLLTYRIATCYLVFSSRMISVSAEGCERSAGIGNCPFAA